MCSMSPPELVIYEKLLCLFCQFIAHLDVQMPQFPGSREQYYYRLAVPLAKASVVGCSKRLFGQREYET